MKSSNVHSGLKTVCFAELLFTIASVLLVIGLVLGLINVVNAGFDYERDVHGFFGYKVLYNVVVALFALSLIIAIIGLWKAGKEEWAFQAAFWIALVTFVLMVVCALICILNSELTDQLDRCVFRPLFSIAMPVIMIYITVGAMRTARNLGDISAPAKGRVIIDTIIVLLVLIILAAAAPLVLGESPAALTVKAVLSMVAALLELVICIVFFIYVTKVCRELSRCEARES